MRFLRQDEPFCEVRLVGLVEAGGLGAHVFQARTVLGGDVGFEEKVHFWAAAFLADVLSDSEVVVHVFAVLGKFLEDLRVFLVLLFKVVLIDQLVRVRVLDKTGEVVLVGDSSIGALAHAVVGSL